MWWSERKRRRSRKKESVNVAWREQGMSDGCGASGHVDVCIITKQKVENGGWRNVRNA
jgi:hypothetical protein